MRKFFNLLRLWFPPPFHTIYIRRKYQDIYTYFCWKDLNPSPHFHTPIHPVPDPDLHPDPRPPHPSTPLPTSPSPSQYCQHPTPLQPTAQPPTHSRPSLPTPMPITARGDDGRWRAVPYEDCMQMKANVLYKFGILECMAQRVYLHFSTALDTWAPMSQSYELVAPPVILERGNSSCIMSAFDRTTPQLHGAALQDMCNNIWLAIVSESPDNVSSSNRYVKAMRTY